MKISIRMHRLGIGFEITKDKGECCDHQTVDVSGEQILVWKKKLADFKKCQKELEKAYMDAEKEECRLLGIKHQPYGNVMGGY